MKEQTRDLLLWLAGLGGAVILLEALLGVLAWVGLGVVALARILPGMAVLLFAGLLVAFFLVRRLLPRNEEERTP